MDLILEDIEVDGYHKVVKVTESKSNLLGIIAIHSLELGPGVGGIRFRNYDCFDEALTDVLRLAEGMTYKFAVLPCSFGGAKSVIIGDPKKDKSPELLKAFGAAIDKLGGSYIGAEDSGINEDDLDIIKQSTSHLIGLHDGAGNPAPFTAWGTFKGIEASLYKKFGSKSIEDKVIAIQGVGAVGETLAEHLFWRGAKLIISDVNKGALERISKKFGAKICPPEEITKVKCDVFAPCAFGGVLNKDTIKDLKCSIVAGAANNQLLNPSDADLLLKRDILYAPDFVINGGGALNCVAEIDPKGYNPLYVRKYVDQIFNQLLKIYNLAEENLTTTYNAAIQLAESRLNTNFAEVS